MRALSFVLALAPLALGCSLGNIGAEACVNSDECLVAFGVGSTCNGGYCSAAATCTTGHDCRFAVGYGACIEGTCRAELPANDLCTIVDPDDLATKVATDRIVGGMMPMSQGSYDAMGKAARLAIREINKAGGDAQGAEIGIVFCDNGGPDDAAEGDARKALIEQSLDYLSGTLGVPYIVGPATSADSIDAINYLLEKQYPTALISASATSPSLASQADKLAVEDEFGLFWRTVPSDQLQGKVLAEQVVDGTINSVAIVYLNDPYGTGLRDAFSDAYLALNPPMPNPPTKFVQLHPYSSPTDFPGIVTDIETNMPASQAVLVIAVSAADAVAFMNAATVSPAVQTLPFFLTDGAKEGPVFFDPGISPGVKAILTNAKGTAPAVPDGNLYPIFTANLDLEFGLDASTYAFLANAYDAAYVGSYAMVGAGKAGTQFDGRQVAIGLGTLLVGATPIDVGQPQWPQGKGAIIDGGTIDVTGTSGDLDFDPVLGQAPAKIEIWQCIFPMMGAPFFMTTNVDP